MKNLKTFLFVYVLLIASTNYSLFAQIADIERLKQEIDSINKIIDEAAKKQDFETIANYYTDDVITLPNNEPLIKGKTAFIQNEMKAAKMGMTILSIKSEWVDIFADGNLIHEIGEYEVKLEIKNVPYPIIDKGKYLVLWQRQEDGSLKIKLETWNNNEEPEY